MLNPADLFCGGNGAISFVCVVIFAGIGSYAGSYLKRKGENLATHEDLSELVEQVSAVTQATRSIESAISEGIWNRQKQWELRRDVLVDTAKRLAEIREALFDIVSISHASDEHPELNWREDREAAYQRWHRASSSIGEMRLLVDAVCAEETAAAIGKFEEIASRIVARTSEVKGNLNPYDQLRKNFDEALSDAVVAVGKELRIKE